MLELKENIISEKKNLNLIMGKIKRNFTLIGFEALVWIVSLFYLAFIHFPGGTHITICPLANLGIEFCPGCGLGNSISYLFRFDIVSSFNTHPLGIFALIVLTLRIINIIKNNWRRYA